MSIFLRQRASNHTEVTLQGLTVAFSYETAIAFQIDHGEWVVRQNDWGPTTGKHLNYYETDKSKRLQGDLFETELYAALRV